MPSIFRFFLLDCITAKPYFKPRNLIVFLVMAVVGYILMGSLGVVFIMFIILNMSSYLFSAGKDGLDCLYATLAIERKTVIAGRYLSSIILTALFLLSYFIVGLIISLIMGNDFSAAGFAFVVLLVFFSATFFSFITMPVLFKLGFKQGKLFAGLFPMAIMLGILLILHLQGLDLDYYASHEFTANLGGLLLYDELLAGGFGAIMGLIGIWLIGLLGSAALSMLFYNKRSF